MVQEKKLALSEEAKDELEKQTELLKQVLEDKEKEISDTKNQFRQANEEAIHEYHDSDTLLVGLGGFFSEGFDDAILYVKSSYIDLDISHVNIDAQTQTSVQLVHSESMDELFADDAFINGPHGDRGIAIESQTKTIEVSTRQPKGQVLEDDDALVQQ